MTPCRNKSLSIGILGLLLVILGTALYFFSPVIFRIILQKEMPVLPTAKSYELWKDTSSLPPMYLKIYFFNWTNPEELEVPNKKPNLVQVGPYAFREIKEKVNITFHPENNTVSYLQKRSWYFDQEQSNGSLTDNITQLNVVAISAAHKVRYWASMMQNTLSFVLASSKVYVVKNVGDLLFNGYEDNLIQLGKIAALDDDVPPFDRFGWFYARNGSTDFDGHYNMDTGAGDIRNLGVLRNWNHGNTTKYFDRQCNMVEGSAGEFWPPDRTKDEITLFSGDLCRPLIYEYEETTLQRGVEGYKYVLADKSLGNDTKRRIPHDRAKYFRPTTTTEDNLTEDHPSQVTESPVDDPDIVNMGHCYCNGKCTPSGLMNITSCRYGAPAFVSLPHFRRADPMLRKQVVGMNPTEDHDFYITLEPRTGIPLEVAARLQVNILLQKSESISLFGDVPTIYFPVFWFTLTVQSPEYLVNDLKKLLSLTSIFSYAGVILSVIGAIILLTVALLYMLKSEKSAVMPNGKSTKAGILPTGAGGKSELVYMDKSSNNEDPHVRSDRKLYPNAIECFNMDLQKLQSCTDQKPDAYSS